jgi:hypothetical protein
MADTIKVTAEIEVDKSKVKKSAEAIQKELEKEQRRAAQRQADDLRRGAGWFQTRSGAWRTPQQAWQENAAVVRRQQADERRARNEQRAEQEREAAKERRAARAAKTREREDLAAETRRIKTERRVAMEKRRADAEAARTIEAGRRRAAGWFEDREGRLISPQGAYEENRRRTAALRRAAEAATKKPPIIKPGASSSIEYLYRMHGLPTPDEQAKAAAGWFKDRDGRWVNPNQVYIQDARHSARRTKAAARSAQQSQLAQANQAAAIMGLIGGGGGLAGIGGGIGGLASGNIGAAAGAMIGKMTSWVLGHAFPLTEGAQIFSGERNAVNANVGPYSASQLIHQWKGTRGYTARSRGMTAQQFFANTRAGGLGAGLGAMSATDMLDLERLGVSSGQAAGFGGTMRAIGVKPGEVMREFGRAMTIAKAAGLGDGRFAQALAPLEAISAHLLQLGNRQGAAGLSRYATMGLQRGYTGAHGLGVGMGIVSSMRGAAIDEDPITLLAYGADRIGGLRALAKASEGRPQDVEAAMQRMGATPGGALSYIMRRVRQGVSFSAAQRELYGRPSAVAKPSNIAWEAAKLEDAPGAWQLGAERNVDYMTGRLGERFVPALDAWRTFMRRDSEKALKWILDTFVPGLNAGTVLSTPAYGSPRQTLSWAQQEKPRVAKALSKARVALGQMPDLAEWLERKGPQSGDESDWRGQYESEMRAARSAVSNLESRQNAITIHEQVAKRLIAARKGYTPDLQIALGQLFDASTGHDAFVANPVALKTNQILERILRAIEKQKK